MVEGRRVPPGRRWTIFGNQEQNPVLIPTLIAYVDHFEFALSTFCQARCTIITKRNHGLSIDNRRNHPHHHHHGILSLPPWSTIQTTPQQEWQVGQIIIVQVCQIDIDASRQIIQKRRYIPLLFSRHFGGEPSSCFSGVQVIQRDIRSVHDDGGAICNAIIPSARHYQYQSTNGAPRHDSISSSSRFFTT